MQRKPIRGITRGRQNSGKQRNAEACAYGFVDNEAAMGRDITLSSEGC